MDVFGYNYVRPPGTYYDIISHPVNAKNVIEVATVQEHRFVFFYWLKWMNGNGGLSCPPDVISLDWHTDLAQPCDMEKSWSKELNQSDYKEIAYFCWEKLHVGNDGHILAAAYLDIVGDIYVVQKQRDSYVDSFMDINGKRHAIRCYKSVDELVVDIESVEMDSIIFDIDLDYFTESPDSCGGGKDVKLVSEMEIRNNICVGGSLMSYVLPRMCGMTIATEPEFCGGMNNSNKLYNIVNDELFFPPLVSHHIAGWKHHA